MDDTIVIENGGRLLASNPELFWVGFYRCHKPVSNPIALLTGKPTIALMEACVPEKMRDNHIFFKVPGGSNEECELWALWTDGKVSIYDQAPKHERW